MAARSRHAAQTNDIWPGFVDALSTLLLVIIFLLVAFVLAQHFLSLTVAGQDAALDRLSQQVEELADQLALERRTSEELRLNLDQLSAELQSSIESRDGFAARLAEATATIATDTDTISEQSKEIDGLRAALAEARERAATLAARLESEEERSAAASKDVAARDARITELDRSLASRGSELEAARRLSEKSRDRVDLLNRQILALREQLAGIAKALDASEAKAAAQKVAIADLGKRLNVALAAKVQELERYRSEFFGRLREALADRPDVRAQGDRFVFQSEVLFETGSAEIGPGGRQELAALARALIEISAAIPDDLPWILRVDGHTDKVPISTARFPSNWELSTTRAISVVRFLADLGIPSERLAATGFGEFQPLDPDETPEALRRNRRIEIKLTTR